VADSLPNPHVLPDSFEPHLDTAQITLANKVMKVSFSSAEE
jgi:hypothetical protein